jgi:hypothetical protein
MLHALCPMTAERNDLMTLEVYDARPKSAIPLPKSEIEKSLVETAALCCPSSAQGPLTRPPVCLGRRLFWHCLG